MDYESFAQQFTQKLKEYLGDDKVVLERRSIRKVNETLDRVSVRYPDTRISPIVYLDEQYKRYRNGWSIDKLVGDMAAQIQEARNNIPQIPELEKEFALKNLYCAVINGDSNRDLH